jgi:hypothetical protein
MGPVSCSGYCGDGICQTSQGENCTTCYADCVNPINGTPGQANCQPHCGDHYCQAGEDCMNCPQDCANGVTPVCDYKNNSPVGPSGDGVTYKDIPDQNQGCSGYVQNTQQSATWPTACSACCGGGYDVPLATCVAATVGAGQACGIAVIVAALSHGWGDNHRYRTCSNNCQWNDWGYCDGSSCYSTQSCFAGTDGLCH